MEVITMNKKLIWKNKKSYVSENEYQSLHKTEKSYILDAGKKIEYYRINDCKKIIDDQLKNTTLTIIDILTMYCTPYKTISNIR